MSDDPFAALGLPVRSDLSDDDVRAAWKRIAAATHPDREDGGDPARFGAAAAAYATLRTSFGRGEAVADIGSAHRGRHRSSGPRGRRRLPQGLAARIGIGLAGVAGLRRGRGRGRSTGLGGHGHGHGRRVALRAAVVLGVAVTAALGAGWTPATIGVLVGALTWAAVTSRAGAGW